MSGNGLIYEIMQMERIVADISVNGSVSIYNEKFMPYDLYLEEESADIDVLVTLCVQGWNYLLKDVR